MSVTKKKHPPTAKSLLNLKPFKKGQVANPIGARAQNPELRALKHLTNGELVEVGSYILENNIPALKEIIKEGEKNPESKTSALKMWMANVALKGFQKGDGSALDIFLNRIVGKVKDNIQVNTTVNRPQVVIMLPAKDLKSVEVLPDINVTPKPEGTDGSGT